MAEDGFKTLLFMRIQRVPVLTVKLLGLDTICLKVPAPNQKT